jgi:hypothetical protein
MDFTHASMRDLKKSKDITQLANKEKVKQIANKIRKY